jgi:hypothetical protein
MIRRSGRIAGLGGRIDGGACRLNDTGNPIVVIAGRSRRRSHLVVHVGWRSGRYDLRQIGGDRRRHCHRLFALNDHIRRAGSKHDGD